MASYSSRVKKDVARWVEQGFIDQIAGDKIARDVEQHERRSLSFGNVLAIMAALLLAAAILVLIAANWEAIPRLVRVFALFAIMLGGYVGGAVLKNTGHPGIAEAVWIVAAATFGGAIALIGQMYHLSGDETAVILVWSIATGLAAAALQSGPLTVSAVGLGIAWLFFAGFDIWSNKEVPLSYPLLMAALWAVSLWTGSNAARHLILLSLVFFVVLLSFDYDLLNIALALAVVSAALFALAVYFPGPVERLVQLDGRFPVHCLIGFLTGMPILQVWLTDDTAAFAISAVVIIAGIVGALLLAGRESRGFRWIAYLGFTLELVIVYVILAGSMLGTAGLFLTAGVALGLVAFFIIRIEKRMNAPAIEGASA
ncbi:MAG TPA: DUF2157 domain-containing protein [Rhizobiaceae bacterium]|nr:DUF2157 domain-containing protein [Rhizobiaceae bacterium]